MLNKTCFEVDYLGTTVVDKRFTPPMVPWVMADIKKRKKVLKIKLSIENREVKGIMENECILFRHDIQKLVSFYYEPSNFKFFLYLIRQDSDPLLHCYLYEAPDFEDVVEIFQAMKENSREHVHWQKPFKSHSSASSLISLCPDISPSNSQFFEVLYVGKIKVSHRNVPITFVDEALEKIKSLELKKAKKLIGGNNLCTATNSNIKAEVKNELLKNLGDKQDKILMSNNSNENRKNIYDHPKKLKSSFSHDSLLVKADLQSVPGISDNQIIYDITNQNIPTKNENVTNAEGLVSLINKDDLTRASNEMGFHRTRTGSLGLIETFKKKATESSQNRTMLFYVGKTDLRLISPDRKQVLLHEKFKDVVSCIQGLQHSQHFGFICREEDYYIAYLFKCESDSVADDIVSVITQSFHSIKEIKRPIPSCEHCPMVWFHRLCSELEGLNDKKTQSTILKRIETLPAEENEIIHTKYLGTESSNIKEQNEFLMILLRTHCEAKQNRHVHDTAENRSEFINQYLGGSAIFMKAKRSLTSSFDQLLKRKGSQLDNTLQEPNPKETFNKKFESTVHEINFIGSHASSIGDNGKTESKNHVHPNSCENVKSQCRLEKSDEIDSSKQSKKPNFPDITALTVDNHKIEEKDFQSNATADKKMEDELSNTPMLNIFLKVGSTTKSPQNDNILSNEMSPTSNGSWRQAIFHQVVTPEKSESFSGKVWRIRTKEELRDLWRKAINQQLLLIRMEKENARLRERQEEATVKRIKLEYDELGSLNKEYMGIWELISNKDSRQIFSKYDHQMMLQAVRQGIPPAKRGDVWHFLAVQYCLKQSLFDTTDFPNYDVPYEDLLKQLTSFQHAILIDLGRTFPNHPYFSSPLGPGQLALFNLLKAYSLLDPQVGYCQGLSFIAGVLLLHMSEEAAFLLLKHLMFRRELRKQYLPNMAALQVQLYQLTRLLYDILPRLYAHFDRNEVAPTLYAAPWMLTLFASQFPLGFVTRVFDLLFLEHTTDIIFRVILALLEEHMEFLLRNSTFEEIMNYLKNEIPKMVGVQVEKIMKRVLTMDISKRLHEYEVEYHVLQEEVSTSRPKLEELKKLELENERLKEQNIKLIEQLEIANNNSNRLEKSWDTQQLVINRLETQIRNLEITISTLGDFISCTCENHSEIEVPGDIRRVLSNLELAQFRNIKQLKTEFSFKKKSDKTSLLKKSHTSIGFIEEDNFYKTKDLNCDELLNSPKLNEKFSQNVNNGEGLERSDKQKTNSIRGVPLRVIADENEQERKKIGSNSSNLTSKITSGVSFFFNTSQNQLKCNKDKGFLQENSFLGNNKINENFNYEEQMLKIFSNEIGSLNIRGSVINGTKKDELHEDFNKNHTNDLPHVESLENSNLKSEPIRDDDTTIRFHPLDLCDDVNITYNGTRKLKSIKSGPKLNRSSTTIYCE